MRYGGFHIGTNPVSGGSTGIDHDDVNLAGLVMLSTLLGMVSWPFALDTLRRAGFALVCVRQRTEA